MLTGAWTAAEEVGDVRIYRERIGPMSEAIVKALLEADLVEVEPELKPEVELDVASVLKEYRRTDWELSEKARDIVAARGQDYSQTRKVKAKLASREKFGLGEDAIEWIVQQILEILLQSNNVEEIFGEDHELRRVVAPVLKKELGLEGSLELEVKKRLKHLEEGTEAYDVEYERAKKKLRRARGLDE
ncbi:MAG: DUF507 family protein [Myxococcota bacterium]